MFERVDEGHQLVFRQLLGEERIDGIGQGLDFAWAGRPAADQVFDDRVDLLVATLGRGHAQHRDFGQVLLPLNFDFAPLHVFDQGIETRVFGDDVEIGVRLANRELADVERDVEIQRIFPVAADLYIPGTLAQFLHGLGQVEGDLGLAGAHENKHLERVAGKDFKIFGADVFEVDEYVVGGQGWFLRIKV